MHDKNSTNNSIGCTVTDCRYHDTTDYCTLDHIDVVKSETMEDVAAQEATDCGSYELKD
ncbi:MAG: DUF1540 domain-containing protein [Firmicutes bacterium HGW-Firmicutes-1]|jgi:hypothetical protein|nr:MAG: DUF1540 domain-containing protein [Firmicutes bacterium HGW-Firmicutes-1]